MEWLFGITAIIGIGASIAGTTIYLRRETKRAMEAWREVVKRLGGYVPRVRGVVGGSILQDGAVAPVLDLLELMRER